MLVYDRPIGNDGLRWNDLQQWWSDTEQIADATQAKRSLYTRLKASLPRNSPPQSVLFDAFFEGFRSAVPNLPALLPEVWLHWDPREDDKELPALEDFIRQLDTVDPGSFAFRYPTTKKGEVSLPELRHVNVRHLSEVMDSVFMLLGGIYSWLGEMEQNDGYY